MLTFFLRKMKGSIPFAKEKPKCGTEMKWIALAPYIPLTDYKSGLYNFHWVSRYYSTKNTLDY